MQILELAFPAFGPFTDLSLRFDDPAPGLQLIHGANEAGKSSALRGLFGLLFGIPHRSQDDFRHPSNKLRIVGHLVNQAGEELRVTRRKGRGATLADERGEPLGDDVLRPFLHGVDADLFRSAFGIDYDGLVRGGQDILEQRGEVGQALFGASLGAGTHRVLEALEGEAEALFLPRGSTQSINRALKDYKDIMSAMRDASLAVSHWDEKRRELQRRAQALDELDRDLFQARTERDALERLRRTRPLLVRRHALRQSLREMDAVVSLPADFAERREQAIRRRDTAQERYSGADRDRQELQQRLARREVPTQLLAHADRVERLFQELGSYNKAQRDLPGLVTRRDHARRRAADAVAPLRPGLMPAQGPIERVALELRPGLRARIAELANQREGVEARLERAQARCREEGSGYQQLLLQQQRGEVIADPAALAAVLAAARDDGDLERERDARVQRAQRLAREGGDRLTALGRWGGAFDALPTTALPSPAQLREFQGEYRQLHEQVQRAVQAEEDARRDRAGVCRELDAVAGAAPVPSEQELQQARQRRERSWQQLRVRWLGQGDGAQPDGDRHDDESGGAGEALADERRLAQATELERATAEADEVADRLRREADRVQRRAELEAQRGELETHLAALADRQRGYDDQAQQLDARWRALWAPLSIDPATPEVMLEWLDEMRALSTQATQWQESMQRRREYEQRIAGHRDALIAAIQAIGDDELDVTLPLTRLQQAAAALVERHERQLREQRQLAVDLEQAQQRLDAATNAQAGDQQALTSWWQQWGEAVSALALDPDAPSAAVDEVLTRLDRATTAVDEADELATRIQDIEREARVFRDQGAALIAQLMPELAQQPLDQGLSELNAAVGQAREDQAVVADLGRNLKRVEVDLRTAQLDLELARKQLAELCREAQCSEDGELSAALERSSEVKRQRQLLRAVEDDLITQGDGRPVDELEHAADSAQGDAEQRIAQLTARIDEDLEPRRRQLAEDRGRARAELDVMDGSGEAAARAEQASQLLAGVRREGRQYLRLVLARRLLRDEIERYREAHQGPMMQRGSELFQALTLGSFDALRADPDERGTRVLRGIRADGDLVGVAGMSAGTRDQLYLALRLAAWEHYSASAEPMPLVVDDILVHFDDARSRAALRVLAELGKSNQVILFTHHRRLAEEVGSMTGEYPVAVHELGGNLEL